LAAGAPPWRNDRLVLSTHLGMKISTVQNYKSQSINVNFDRNARNQLRLLGFLAGGLGRDPAALTKYGLFFQSLEAKFELLGMHEVSLGGYRRFLSGLLNFHPNKRMWKERYYKNIYSFKQRSLNAARIQERYRGRVDLTLQVGVLFDAYWRDLSLPNIIFTDWTARLSSENPYGFRSPLKGRDLASWLDYERQAFQNAAHVFTRSELVRSDIVNNYGIHPGKVSVAGGGVNLEVFPERAKSLQKTGFPVILFIGSEFKRKGGEVLLRAFSIAQKRVPSARLKLLTRDVVPRDLPLENVDLVPYVWDREQVYRLYEEADIFVLPSREETWGDVLLEAAAYGVPSIGVSGGVMNEIIKDGETGCLTQLDNVEALASTMILLLENKELRLRLGENARDYVTSFFTWDHVVERMLSKIETIFSGKELRL